MLNVILIDDEPDAIDVLKVYCNRMPELIKSVLHTCNPEDGLKLINETEADVVFLDINMPAMNGMDLLDNIYDTKKKFKLIFTTAHSQYAINAIKRKAYDYLLKPINFKDFKRNIEEIFNEKIQHSKKRKSVLEIPQNDGILFIKHEEIKYIVAEGSYSTIFTVNGKKTMISKNLKFLEDTLEWNKDFLRCHASYIVNTKFIQKLVLTKDEQKVVLDDGSGIDIGRKYKEDFIMALKGQ